MRTLICLGVMLCAGIGAAEGLRPHEATVFEYGRPDSLEVYVVTETVDALVYSQDSGGTQRGRFSHDRIERTEYGPVSHPAYYQARSDIEDQPGEAAAGFQKVATEGKSEWDRINGYLGMIEAWGKAGEPKRAAAAADRMAETFPRSVYLLRALRRKTEILVAADLLAEAAAAYAAIGERDFGSMQPQADALAVGGKARVAGLRGDHAAAVAIVDGGLAALDRAEQPQAYADLAIIGIREHLALDDLAAAETLAAQIRYLGEDAAIQAEAHLVLARAKQESDREAAFDHAVIAAVRAPSDSAVAIQARSLARRLGTGLSDDESLPIEYRRDYKSYLKKL